MKAEFSEFAYSEALVRELKLALSPEVAVCPLFGRIATELEEQVPDAGVLLFLRFHLADCMLTPRATGWPEQQARFYRLEVPLRYRSQQHNVLRRLSEKEPEVYYAAAAFYRQREFSAAFSSAQIIQESRFFQLRELPDLTDDGYHYIAYRREESGFRWLAQDSRPINLPVTGEDWLHHVRSLALKPRSLGWRFLLGLRQDLASCLQQTEVQPPLFDELAVDLKEVTPLTVLRDLHYLLLTHFGLEALILRSA
jgi:hypothetical protein